MTMATNSQPRVVLNDNGNKFTTLQMHQMVWQNRRKGFKGDVGIVAFRFNI